MRSKIFIFFGILLLVALSLSGCAEEGTPEETVEPEVVFTPDPVFETEPARPTEPGAEGPRNLTVMTHDSFAVSEEVVREFEETNNARVQFLPSGDTGSALNRAILSKNNPIADVFYGVDNTFLSRALDEGIFVQYESPALAFIPDIYELDSEHRALPVDYGDVCLNYDIGYLEELGIDPPNDLEDLLATEYESLLVVQNPATSSPGLAFLLATIGHFGEDGYLEYWQGLVENDVLVVNSWENAYYTEFTRSGGTRPIVVSYSSSPPFEVLFADEPMDEPPTASVIANESCFRQIEFVGILEGTANLDLAQRWVDFMLSPTFQEDLPLQMFVFPVNDNAVLDETFVQYLENPDDTASVSPEEIAENRERWIQEWTETVLR